MNLLYRILADSIVVVHALYVGAVVLGLVFVLVGRLAGWDWVRNFWFRTAHLAMIGIVVAESLAEITCPLTTWEDALRRRAGETVQEGAFLARWAHQLIFFEAPNWVFTVGYCLFGLAVLLALVIVPPRCPEWLRRRSRPR